MKNLSLLTILFIGLQPLARAQDIWVLDSTVVHVEIVLDSSLIDGAWDVNWGPDNKLWFTDLEYIQRYDPVTGVHDTLLYRQGENALGFAVHNDLENGTPYVFVAYDTTDYYSYGYLVNLYRYEYSNGQLINPLLLIAYEHAGEHAGGRVIITDDDKLMVTTADYWFGGDPLKGRTLRLNFDGSIPSDNPNPADYEFTSGHRNPQGLVQIPNGKIYNSEHGQAGSDEINLLVSGGHYGWPAYDADNCLGVVPDSCTSLTYSYISPLNTTIAPPSGVDYYNHTAIPEFTNSLLVGTLWGSMSMDAHTLSASGDAVTDYHKYLNVSGYGRIRDLTVLPDGSIYFIGFDRQPPTAIYHLYNPALSNIDVNTGSSMITVFPNPSDEEITVQWNPENEFVQIRLMDLSGKVMISQNLSKGNHQYHLSVAAFNAGLYIIELSSEKGMAQYQKVLVK